jgi:hypothetical protein
MEIVMQSKRSVIGVSTFCMLFFSIAAYAETGPQMVEREFYVPTEGGVTQYIKQHSFKNSNGTYTLIAGQRTEQLKSIHEQRCASIGGKDVYDESVITVSEDVADVTICQNEQVRGDDQRGSDFVATDQSQTNAASSLSYGNHYFPPAITLVPANRNVPVMSNYNLRNYMYYSTRPDTRGRYFMNMIADNCSMSTGGTVGTNVFKGKLALVVTCLSHNPGTWPVYLNGGIPGVSGTAVGEIRASN